MDRQRLPRYAMIVAVVLGVVWAGMWIASAHSHQSKTSGISHGPEVARLKVDPLSDAEVAKTTALVAVVDVIDSTFLVVTPPGGNSEPGLGDYETKYSLRLLRVLKADPSTFERTVELWVPGEPTAAGRLADFYPNVGSRYLVIAWLYEGHYFIPAAGGGFTEITSPEQEAELVDYWNGLIGATPEATSTGSAVAGPTNTAVGTTGPTEQATEPATDTAVPTELPTNVTTDTPTSAATDTPTVVVTQTPTIDAGSSTPTPTTGA